MKGRQSFILLVIFIGYLAIGGVIFMFLENGVVENVDTIITEIGRNELNDILQQWNDSLNQNESIDLRQMMQQLKNLSEQEPDIQEVVTIREWDFYDAFFFSLTVITTIGYGHLCPITEGAQVFCIFYAIVGVPLTGILIAAFGDIFSSVLLKAHERSKNERFNSTFALVVNTIFYLIPGTIVFLFLPAVVFAYLEDWSYLQSFYYAFITLTTIGFGDYVAGHEKEFDNRWVYQVGIMVWIVFGLGYWAMMLNFIVKAMKSKQVKRFNKTVSRGFRQTQRMISKEMEEFIHSMNQYSTKIMPKPQTKLKRTKSLPLFNKHHISENGRCASDSALMIHAEKDDDDIYIIQQEAHTNTMGFIFQLAKAFAYGDLGAAAADSISMRSLRSGSRHPSLLELITESMVQSRRGSVRDPSLLSTRPMFNRLQPNRRSSEIPDLRTMGLLDSSGGFAPRRCSDFGCYTETTKPPQPAPVLEEVNELDSSNNSESKDTLMSNASSTPKSRQRRKLSTSQEIDELLLELKHLETILTPEQPSATNGKIHPGEVKQLPYQVIPTVEITAPQANP